MTKILLSRNGVPIGDYDALNYILDNIGKEIHVSTENVLFALKLLLSTDSIDFNDVELQINNKQVYISDNYEFVFEDGSPYGCWFDIIIDSIVASRYYGENSKDLHKYLDILSN